MTHIVHFDRPLRHLHPSQALQWQLWLTKLGLESLQIRCPSELKWNEGKLSLTVERLVDEPGGRTPRKDVLRFDESVLPFPEGYEVVKRRG